MGSQSKEEVNDKQSDVQEQTSHGKRGNIDIHQIVIWTPPPPKKKKKKKKIFKKKKEKKKKKKTRQKIIKGRKQN